MLFIKHMLSIPHRLGSAGYRRGQSFGTQSEASAVVFETGSLLCGVHADLNIIMKSSLASDAGPSCFCLPSVEVRGVQHNTWPQSLLLRGSNMMGGRNTN